MSGETSWTEHILNGKTWLRFLIMLLYTPLLACVGFLIACIALFQFFAMLASGESNPELRALGRDLSRLATDTADFLTCNTDRRPFPFQSDVKEAAAAPNATREKSPQPANAAPGTAAKTSDRAPRRKAAAKRKRAPRKKTTTRRRPASSRKKTGSKGAGSSETAENRPSPEQRQNSEKTGDEENPERSE